MSDIILNPDKGLGIPIKTTAAKDAITSPATGSLVYDSDQGVVNQYNGSAWQGVLTSGTPTLLPKGVPVVRATLSSTQTITGGVWTKVQFNNKTFDTNNFFDNITNYRFQPTIAGYYQINAGVMYASGVATAVLAGLYKNGSLYHNIGYAYSSSQSLDDWQVSGSCLMYMNGSTDYAELYGYVIGSSPHFYGSSGNNSTFFEAVLARAD